MTKRKSRKPRSRRPLALVTSDNHLQEMAWASREELYGDALWAFSWIVDYAIDAKIPRIIAAGDLIDRPRNEAFIAWYLREKIEQMEANNIMLYFIQGQHDYQPTPWAQAVSSDTAFWLQPWSRIVVGDYIMAGLDWTQASLLDEGLSKVDETVDILVMHQVCQEFMEEIAALGGSKVEFSWERTPYAKMLIIGDYHNRHCRLERKNREGKPLSVLCPGSTAMQKITEPPDKYCFVLYDDLSTESLKIPTRVVLKPPPLTMEEDLDGFIEAAESQIKEAYATARSRNLPEDMRTPILYVKYSGDLPGAYQRIVSAIGDQAHLFHQEIRSDRLEVDAEQVQERRNVIEGGLLGALTEVAEPGTVRFELAKRLLSAPNKARELAAIRKEFFSERGVE